MKQIHILLKKKTFKICSPEIASRIPPHTCEFDRVLSYWFINFEASIKLRNHSYSSRLRY